jgi:hypothetical protein
LIVVNLLTDYFQNLCVTAAHRPIREILEKEKKVCFNLLSFPCVLYSLGFEYYQLVVAKSMDQN